MKEIKNSNCPLCNFNKASLAFIRKNDTKIIKCPNCKLHYMFPMYTEEELKNLYSSDEYFESYSNDNNIEYYLQYNENALHNKKSHFYFRLGKIKKYANRKNLFEIGSACGDFLNFCYNNDFNVEGLELNERARNLSLERYPGIKIYTGYLEEVKLERKFDVICFFAVLEHIEEPHSFIETVKKNLNPDGIVYISVPNINTYYFLRKRWPDLYCSFEHVVYYSPNTLTKLMKQHNFKLEWINTIKFDLIDKKLPYKIIHTILPLFNAGNEIEAIFRIKN